MEEGGSKCREFCKINICFREIYKLIPPFSFIHARNVFPLGKWFDDGEKQQRKRSKSFSLERLLEGNLIRALILFKSTTVSRKRNFFTTFVLWWWNYFLKHESSNFPSLHLKKDFLFQLTQTIYRFLGYWSSGWKHSPQLENCDRIRRRLSSFGKVKLWSTFNYTESRFLFCKRFDLRSRLLFLLPDVC